MRRLCKNNNGDYMTNEHLVALIQNHKDEAENMLELWKNNQGFIYMSAKHYSGREDVEDLMQVGYIGLCEAVDHYDAREGVQFITYAAFWVKQAMRRHVMSNGSLLRVPEYMAQQLTRYRQLILEYKKRFGREPAQREIRALLDVSWEMLERIEKAAVASNVGSLDAPIKDADGELTVGDVVADSEDLEQDILDRVWQEELEAIIWPMVDELPDEQPAVIRARFQEGKTREEVGEDIGTTGSHVRTLEENALRKLRSSRCVKQLRPFVEDLAMPLAYQGGISAFRRTGTSSTERAVLRLINQQEKWN